MVFQAPEVLLHRIHVLRADAHRFHPAASLHDVIGDRDETLLCMLEHGRVTPRFPSYAELPAPLQEVLSASTALDQPAADGERALQERTLEDRGAIRLHTTSGRQTPDRDPAAVQAGSDRYERLCRERKAGLLNLYSKLTVVPLPDGTRPWCHVRAIASVERDRLHLRVATALHVQAVRAAASVTTGGRPCFEHADGSLHKPEKGYVLRHSFKTRERFGNLQLTFFAPAGAALADVVDADIDDAAGVEHAEQVVRNEGRKLARALFGWFARNLPEGKTHPYDIHQIVRYHQGQASNHPGSACDGRILAYQPLYSLEYRADDGTAHSL